MSLNADVLTTFEGLQIETKYDHLYKIIIIGDSCVGKTALLSKYLKGVFPTSPLSTVATEFATKIIQIKEGGYIKAQIWDTAGEEKYKSITYHHYKKSVGGLIVYDITKRATYENVKNWYTDLINKAEKGCMIALIEIVVRNIRILWFATLLYAFGLLISLWRKMQYLKVGSINPFLEN